MPARLVPAAMILAAALPALAGDAPLPPLTPEGEYLVMTQDDASSTSTCIGNPVTPLCAVETVMACLLRRDDGLCRIGMGLAEKSGRGQGTRVYEKRLYRIVNAEFLESDGRLWRPNLLALDRENVKAMQPGDIRLDVIERNCLRLSLSSECDSEWSGPEAYIIRRNGGHWAVTIWGPADDPDYPRGSD